MIEKKQKVIELIKERGPSLPSHLSKEIGLSLLFTSALLSEMVAEKSLKISFLKIGGSPLYYLEGQENLLENFLDYLPQQEKEAVKMLKENKILEDDKLTPLQRVALRNTKDFAKMLKQKINDKEKIFWCYFLVPEEEAQKEIEKVWKTEEIKEQKIEEKIVKEIVAPREKRKVKKADSAKKILEKLKEKGLEVVSEFQEKNKIGIVLANSDVGKLKFLVYALNKKTITEADLSLASLHGQEEKLPVLFVTEGKLTKKASEYLKKISNVIICSL